MIFDFGSQYGQLIARRVREQNVFCQIVRHDLSAERVAELKPARPDLFRRPGQRLRTRRPAVRSRPSSTWASRCSASATACSSPARCWAARSSRPPAGSSAGPTATFSEADGLFAGVPEETDRLDEPRRPGADGQRRLRAAGRHRHLPGRRRPPSQPAGLRLAVPPRGQPHALRQPDPAQLPLRRLRLPGARGRWSRSSSRPWPSCGSASATTASSAACPAASIRR